MADLPPGAQKLLGFYGSILSAATLRLTTAEVWNAIRNAATNTAAWLEGVPASDAASNPEVEARASQLLSGIGGTDVSVLRGIAGQQQRAIEALRAASADQSIVADMIGRPPNSITGSPGGLPESYRVRYLQDVITSDGQVLQQWRTWWLNRPPTTVADLRASTELESAATAARYGLTHTGVSSIALEIA